MKSKKELEKLFEVSGEALEAMEAKAGEGLLPGEPVGEVLRGPGRPKLSNENTEVLSVKLPAGLKAQLAQRAAENDVPVSVYVRKVLTDSLAASA